MLMYRGQYYEDDQPTFIDRVRFFLKIFGITFLIAGVGLMVFFSRDKAGKFLPPLQKSLAKVPLPKISVGDVLGSKTKRAASISGEIVSDFKDGGEAAKKQILNMKVSEIISSVVTVASRVQKIPKDVQSMQEYVNEQVGSVVKSKK
jgi:hypothetical protein